MKRYCMEFLGTFFLVLAVALGTNPIGIAAMLMAWVYIGGYISGAHFNPMVSFAMYLIGRLNSMNLLRYVGAQVLGSFAAFALAYFLRKVVAMPHPGIGITLAQAGVVEILLAFVLALVVLTVTVSRKYAGSTIFGFVIGFTIPALAMVGGPISGGLFNPAIALGASIFGALKGAVINWEHLAMYVGCALLGGALAAYAFKYFYSPEEVVIIEIK